MKKTFEELRLMATRRIIETFTGVKDPILPDGSASDALEQRIAAEIDRELADVRRELHNQGR